MNALERKQHVLELVAPRLEDAGYAVFPRPSRQLLPDFMKGYVPDAIALGKPRNLAIEIIQDGQPSTKERSLQERFAGAPDWELRIYYAGKASDEQSIDHVSPGAIEASIAQVEQLAAHGQSKAALLIGWATLEAIGRIFTPADLHRPQPAAQLIERLAGSGIVTPDEAEHLRTLAPLRNQLAHGGLSTEVPAGAISTLVAILRDALSENAPVS